MDKKGLRDAMKRHNRAVTVERRADSSERIFRRIEALSEFAAARCVALYCALGDEPDTQEVLERWRACKRVVLPRVEGEGMRFFGYDPALLVRGAFGIAEPGPGAAHCPPAEIDLIVVPGVAFTAAGARLGRGGGYYDRYLAQAEMRAVRIGVCYAHQILDELPTEPHDRLMDRVVSG